MRPLGLGEWVKGGCFDGAHQSTKRSEREHQHQQPYRRGQQHQHQQPYPYRLSHYPNKHHQTSITPLDLFRASSTPLSVPRGSAAGSHVTLPAGTATSRRLPAQPRHIACRHSHVSRLMSRDPLAPEQDMDPTDKMRARTRLPCLHAHQGYSTLKKAQAQAQNKTRRQHAPHDCMTA